MAIWVDHILVFLHLINVYSTRCSAFIRHQWTRIRRLQTDIRHMISPASTSGGGGVSCFGGGALGDSETAADVKETRTCERRDKSESEVQVSVIEVGECSKNNVDPEMGLARSETRRSKSRVRAYFKRCKDVITGNHHATTGQVIQTQEQNPHPRDDVSINSSIASSHEPVSQTPIWIIDKTDSECGSLTHILTPDPVSVPIPVDYDSQQIKSPPEETTDNLDQKLNELEVNQNQEDYNSVANLVDNYLGHLYPEYQDHTRSVLVRQARDLLLCTYQGNLQKFESEFLAPGSLLINDIKSGCESGQTLAWCRGWPLVVAGAVVLHLGSLDESLIRPQDIYVCIRSGENGPELCASWFSPKLSRIVSRKLDPEKESISPLAIEMLADELPQLLQSLLVGVERVICRLPLDDLSFPASVTTQPNNEEQVADHSESANKDERAANENQARRAPFETGIKRRELITKNKMPNNKYALLRAIKSESSQSSSPEMSLTSTVSSEEGEPQQQSMALFCLGGSFPHIDSDEESADEASKRNPTNPVSNLTNDMVVVSRSIADLPEKLLMSGIYLPGVCDISNTSIISVDGKKLLDSGVNCYEVASVLLYYSTIPTSPIPFTIHVTLNDNSQLSVLDLIDHSLQQIPSSIAIKEIVVSGLENYFEAATKNSLPKSQIEIIHCSSLAVLHRHIPSTSVLRDQGGSLEHSQTNWREFFAMLEPMQSQCIAAGKKLVTVMGDIRNSDIQGVPSRRQLHSQHRALSRALMDPELQSLRRKGLATIARLQEKLKRIGGHKSGTDLQKKSEALPSSGDHANVRLSEVITIYNEVDRAAKRLEYLTEQRRECLREMTRQRALEDEINDVLSWIRTGGEEALNKYNNVSLDCADLIKDQEHEFEKFYFISMKHLAKGRDLHDATLNVDSLKDSARTLKQSLTAFSERLEATRERIEGAARLHHLFGLHLKEDDVLQEMQRLAEKIGKPDLFEKFRQNVMGGSSGKLDISKRTSYQSLVLFTTSTPDKTGSHKLQVKSVSATFNKHQALAQNCNCWVQSIHDSCTETPPNASSTQSQNSCTVVRSHSQSASINALPLLQEEKDNEDDVAFDEEEDNCRKLNFHTRSLNDNSIEEDEEDHSKMADSGLGGCDRCEGDDSKLKRACSCQSFEDATIACAKSHHSDDLEEEDCFGPTQKSSDLPTPFQPNSHLYCHSSNLNLVDLDDVQGIDQKTQKTLLLIMREMIGTERDYVRALHYIIENYTKELLREDIPQALRGQRNVIFGNVERIYEFHHQFFLEELERCEKNPLKVGAAFLRHESKFYLYALYNKNKPKSDSLMSEYGTAFFKSKQLELNDKMDLASYLLKPVQRMGKYALLLQQLMKACSAIKGVALQYIAEDMEELQKAEEMVRFQLRHGNDLLAMDSLRDCDVNVKEQGRLLRQNEFLVWQGRCGKKSLRQIFLFEDLVLFSKARRFPDRKNLDIYIYKNSIKTSDIGLTAHVGDSSTKFEIWFRKRKPDDTWTLQSMSEDIKNTWTDEISRLLWLQARKNREIRLMEMSSMGIGSKPCLDIRPSQNQINDRSISISQLAPKFRNSFMGTLSESKPARRPNSIISVNSMSSGSSSSSGSCSHGSSVSNNGQLSTPISEDHENSAQNHKTEIVPKAKNGKRNHNHHRSTTLVSQCSMESGIIDDISISPDEVSDPPSWSSSLKKLSSKSQSTEEGQTQSPSGSNPYINDTITVHL